MNRQPSSGLKAWIVQRLSAVYIAGFIVFSSVSFVFRPIKSYGDWIQWVGHPAINAALSLFIVALLLHAWVGLRDVIMDYVKAAAVRVALFSIMLFALGGCAFWALRLLVKVSV